MKSSSTPTSLNLACETRLPPLCPGPACPPTMMPFSIFQPALTGMRGGPPRTGTVQPVKSLPLNIGFHGSADCSDAMSTKQRSVTMPKEMPFRLLTERFRENCFCGRCTSLEPTSAGQVVNDWFSQSTGSQNFLPIQDRKSVV